MVSQDRTLGKGLQAHLPADVWEELLQTFSDADPEKNWAALFAMTALFRRIAQQVAEHLGYPFPDNLINGVVSHAHRMRR